MTELFVRLFIRDYKNVENAIVRQKYGMLGGMVGIFCNILLFLAKLFAGLLTSSISITADAFNNLSDAGSCVVSAVGFKMAGRPADHEHPFGHGRIEYISGLIISFVIMLMGLELLKSSAEKIFSPQNVVFSWISFVILLISIGVKLWMGLFNRTLGNRIDSAAMKASAMDSISDVVATSVVALGMLISHFFSLQIDGYLGVLVAGFILYTGFQTAKDTLNPLLGEAPDKEFVESIEQSVLSYEGILGVHDLIVHNYGPGRSVISLHAEVSCEDDILEIHDMIDRIERDLKEKFSCEVVIHMDPIVTDDVETNRVHEKVVQLIGIIDPVLKIHDFRMVKGPTHTNLIFDVVVPYGFRLNDEQLKEAILRAAKTLDESYEVVADIDHSYL